MQVPFETIALAHLVAELDNLGMELPYTEAEIAEFKAMAEFNFEQYSDERPEEEEQGFKTLTIKMTDEQYEIIRSGIDNVIEHNDNCSEARALELIVADYLSGV